MKNPETDDLDAGWDDPEPGPVLSVAPAEDVDDIDAGWDDESLVVPSVQPPATPVVLAPPARTVAAAPTTPRAQTTTSRAQTAARAPARAEPKEMPRGARADRLSKRERRAFERKQRALGEKRRAERRAEEKRERREQARKAAEKREAERREAFERAERARKEREAKRATESPPEAARTPRKRQRSADIVSKPEETRKARFVMPNGGWIIVVIALITLATAWYAFAR